MGVVFVAVEVADFDKCTFGCCFFVAVEVADFDRCAFGCLHVVLVILLILWK